MTWSDWGRDPLERASVPESPEDRVALVTGGGSGVGANIARGLADAGMDVWVTGRTEARIEAPSSSTQLRSGRHPDARAGVSRNDPSRCLVELVNCDGACEGSLAEMDVRRKAS